MPETKTEAIARAKELGIPTTQVVKSTEGSYFIAPRGISSTGAKKAYAECREKSSDKVKCSRIAWSIEKKS